MNQKRTKKMRFYVTNDLFVFNGCLNGLFLKPKCTWSFGIPSSKVLVLQSF